MAAKVGDVVFKAGENVNLEELWDDSALIRAYEKAVNSFKYGSSTDPADNPTFENKKKNRRKRKKNKRQAKDSADECDDSPGNNTLEWNVGEKCQAVFSEDGLVYNAKIIEIYEHTPNICVVRYTDYGNEEEQYLTDLLPFSEDQTAERCDQADGKTSSFFAQNGECSSHRANSEWQISDLCVAPELPEQHYHEAVINSFPSSYTCKVTFIKSRKRQDVNIQDLQEPDNYHHGHHHHKSHEPASGGFNPMFHPFHYPGTPIGNYPFFPFQPPPYPVPPFQSRWPSANNPRQQFTCAKIPRPPIPPPPPPISLGDLHGDDETLASMLMSWYLSGYHTGYFKAVQQFRNNNSVEKPNTNNEDASPQAASHWSPQHTEMDT